MFVSHVFQEGTFNIIAMYPASIVLGFLLSIALFCSLMLCIPLPIHERSSNVRHLQLMTGLCPLDYWLAFYFWDIVFYILLTVIPCLVLVHFMDEMGVFRGDLGKYYALQI